MMTAIVEVILLVLLIIAASNLPEILEEKTKSRRQNTSHMVLISPWSLLNDSGSWSVKETQLILVSQDDGTSTKLSQIA